MKHTDGASLASVLKCVFLKSLTASWKSHGSSAVEGGVPLFNLPLLSSHWDGFFMFGVNKFVHFKKPHLIIMLDLWCLHSKGHVGADEQLFRTFDFPSAPSGDFFSWDAWLVSSWSDHTHGQFVFFGNSNFGSVHFIAFSWFVWIQLHNYLPAWGVFSGKIFFFKWSVFSQWHTPFCNSLFTPIQWE